MYKPNREYDALLGDYEEDNEDILDVLTGDEDFIDEGLELWEPIEGTDNYLVSNYGNVVNDITGRILRPRKAVNGHLRVSLSIKGVKREVYLSTLVAEHFIGGYDRDCCYIRYIDGDLNNNHADNLIIKHQTTCVKHRHHWDSKQLDTSIPAPDQSS